MSEQVRVAPSSRHPGGIVAVPITDGDRLRVLRELPISEGWRELFAMREDGRTWQEILDRACKLRPGMDEHTIRRGLAEVYTQMETRLADIANLRARLVP